MRKTIYIETSIFSFYYDQRQSPAVVAMHEWTREWWRLKKGDYNIVTSTAVLAELDTGSMPHRQDAFEMALTVPAIPIDVEVEEVVNVYIKHKVMPDDPVGDALHLALASMHKCDYLLTWNCNHLANANKFGHIHRINSLLNLYTPILITPLELLGDK